MTKAQSRAIIIIYTAFALVYTLEHLIPPPSYRSRLFPDERLAVVGYLLLARFWHWVYVRVNP